MTANFANITTFAGIGVAIAAFAAGWGTIKGYLLGIYNMLVAEIKSEDRDVQNFIENVIRTNFRKSFFAPLNLYENRLYVKQEKKVVSVLCSKTDTKTTFWYGCKPISWDGKKLTYFRFLFKEKWIVNLIHKESQVFISSMKIDRFQIKKYSGNARTNANKAPLNNNQTEASSGKTIHDYKTVHPYIYKRDDLGQPPTKNPLDLLALSPVVEDTIKEIFMWNESKEWYDEREIPHKKGLLLYGTPGNGKSSFAKAISMELNNPLLVLELADMTNNEFEEAWKNVSSMSPCTVLIEDIDSIFDGRKNMSYPDGGMSFDCLLNCLDGVEKHSGVLVIITTNNLDKVDSAIGKPNGNCISTRPGRIDRAIEFTNPSMEGKLKIAKRILDQFPEEIEVVLQKGSNDSGAQFQERCTRAALSLYWKNKKS